MLFLGSLMSELLRLRPSIDWNGPVTILFNCDVVNTSADTEKAILTPVSAPRVAHPPEGLTVFFAITDHTDDVDNILVTCFITINATSIVFETLGDGDVACKGSALIKLVHYRHLSVSEAELGNFIGRILGRDKTSLARTTISTEAHGGAHLAIGPAATLVD